VTGWWGLLLAAVLIAANGLFVAAEFALVSLRRPNVEHLASEGDRRARLVVRELSEVSFALSSAQFGITATSLLLGYVAEQAVGDTLIRPLLGAFSLPEESALVVTVGAAFVLSTGLQMLLGELFPKNLAIARPQPVALAVIPLTRPFGIVLGPIIRVFDRSAQALTEWVFRVEVASELEGGHSLDEFARIIAASGRDGSLSPAQTQLLRRAVELGDRRVGEVMVPRPDVVWLPATASLADLRTLAEATGYSRFPIHGDHEDDVLGSVHLKDLLTVPAEDHAITPVLDVAVPLLAVPESGPLRRLLADLRRQHRTAALVVDEHGGTAGIVTLEDVLEALVGEIEDEFDEADPKIHRLGTGHTVVDARLRLDRANDLFGQELPEGEYETLAGFVLDQLGHIPEPGEVVSRDRIEITVAGVEGTRITHLSIREIADPGEGG
jgi:CBS domain containing-hemolysin-like protein